VDDRREVIIADLDAEGLGVNAPRAWTAKTRRRGGASEIAVRALPGEIARARSGSALDGGWILL